MKIPAGNWAVFVHWAEPNEAPLAQTGGFPAAGIRPTKTWRQGEIIADRFVLTLPEGAQLTDHALFVGLYNADDPAVRAELHVDGLAVPSGAYELGGGR